MAGRALVLALAAASLVFALVHSPGGDGRAAAVRYRCPMHPDATSPSPAACPICGMALVLERPRGYAPAEPEDAPDRARVVRAAPRVFREDVRAPAWVEPSGAVVAALYRDDLVGLTPGAAAQFFPATAPSAGVDVALAAGPAADWDSSTARARFAVVAPPGTSPRPGDQGSLFIAARPRELLIVPSSAVVTSPEGPCVLVLDATGRRFTRRVVQIGRAHPGGTAILAGLADGEQIAAGNAFFLHAEHRAMPEATP